MGFPTEAPTKVQGLEPRVQVAMASGYAADAIRAAKQRWMINYDVVVAMAKIYELRVARSNVRHSAISKVVRELNRFHPCPNAAGRLSKHVDEKRVLYYLGCFDKD